MSKEIAPSRQVAIKTFATVFKYFCHRGCSLSFVNPHQPRESRRLVFDQRPTIYNLSSINSSARFCHDGTNNVETFFRKLSMGV